MSGTLQGRSVTNERYKWVLHRKERVLQPPNTTPRLVASPTASHFQVPRMLLLGLKIICDSQYQIFVKSWRFLVPRAVESGEGAVESLYYYIINWMFGSSFVFKFALLFQIQFGVLYFNVVPSRKQPITKSGKSLTLYTT